MVETHVVDGTVRVSCGFEAVACIAPQRWEDDWRISRNDEMLDTVGGLSQSRSRACTEPQPRHWPDPKHEPELELERLSSEEAQAESEPAHEFW